MTLYSVRSLCKTCPGQSRPANDDISFDVQPGEIFGLLGDNGAGKSTLVKQMTNLLHPSSGNIALFGKPIDADPMHVPLRVGYMPQDGRALNSLTVGEALYFTAHLRGRSRRDAQSERKRLTEFWALGDLHIRPLVLVVAPSAHCL